MSSHIYDWSRKNSTVKFDEWIGAALGSQSEDLNQKLHQVTIVTS